MASILQELVWWCDNLHEDERPETLLKEARAQLAPRDAEADREACFDYHLNEATHLVMGEFEWLKLPVDEALTTLKYEVNDALEAMMQRFK